MSQEDPKNTSKPEHDSPETTSRRGFLKAGAAAVAVTAVASQPIPADAQSCAGVPYGAVILGPDGKPQCCRKPDDSEAPGFAKIMKAAWDDSAYRASLLTFPEGQATDWFWYSDTDRSAMLKRTRTALEKYITVDSNELPVVLGNAQFERGVFRMKDQRERILRLPDRIFLTPELDKSSLFHEYVVKNHVCGM